MAKKSSGQKRTRKPGQTKTWMVNTQKEWFSQYLPEFQEIRLLGQTGKANEFMVEFINKVYDAFMVKYPNSLAEQNLTDIGLGGTAAEREDGMKTVSQRQTRETVYELTYTSV